VDLPGIGDRSVTATFAVQLRNDATPIDLTLAKRDRGAGKIHAPGGGHGAGLVKHPLRMPMSNGVG
jgi:hypothetical protein